MDIQRQIFNRIKESLKPNKVVVVYGPRRVGKTYLLEKLANELKDKEIIKFDTGENKFTQDYLSSQSTERLKEYLGASTLLIIDEAQKIPNIGLNLKLIVDQIPNIKVLVSGSSPFDLSQQIGEPLTGRKTTLKLFPVSAKEIVENFGLDYQESLLPQNLIFGSFPEVLVSKEQAQKEKYLKELLDSYLLKDLLALEGVKKSKKFIDLLTLLAFQIGQEVSLSELGNNLDLHRNTVYKYLDLLEKAFVVINIRGFSRNLRKEVTKNSRYYFYDNGIRNALINNFNPLNLRNDVGMLWENYIVLERLKKQEYQDIFANNFFWRTYDQKEIDWVEMREGKLLGFEISYQPKGVSKAVRDEWLKTYPEGTLSLVDKENYLNFIA